MKKINLFGIAVIILLLAPLTNATTTYIPETDELQITQTSYEPAPAEPGRYVKIWVDVSNSGSETEEDIWFKLDADYPFSIEDNSKYYSKLNSLQKVTLDYSVWVDAEANEAEYDDKINLLRCYDPECNSKYEIPLTISVRELRPVLEISDIVFEKESIPGEVIPIKIVLNNKGTSRLKDISLQLNLSSSSVPLAPSGSSTERIISSLSSKESKNVVFDLLVDGDADSGNYKIPIDIAYYDESGNIYNKNDIIGLVIGGKPDLTVGLEEYDYFTSGATGEITFNIINKGTSDAKFLDIILLDSEYYEILSPKEIYLGNLDSDDYETAKYKLKMNKLTSDSINIPVHIEYTDINNNKYTEEEEVNFKIYSPSEIREINGGSNYTLWIILGILIIAGIFYYKHKKRKKEE